MKEKTILVVEDDELNLKLVRTLLQFNKFNVLTAMNAEKGIQLAREHRPDLILMDIQLPGMDGLTATGILKNDPELKHIPVVALTAHAMQGDDKKALAAGCNGYLTKPINTRDFRASIEKYFSIDDETNDRIEETS